MAVFYKTKILFEKLEGVILLHYDLRENNKTQNWAACKTDIKPLKTRCTKRIYLQERFVLKIREIFL